MRLNARFACSRNVFELKAVRSKLKLDIKKSCGQCTKSTKNHLTNHNILTKLNSEEYILSDIGNVNHKTVEVSFIKGNSLNTYRNKKKSTNGLLRRTTHGIFEKKNKNKNKNKFVYGFSSHSRYFHS